MYLNDFLNKPRHGLKTALGNASLERLKEDAVVRLWQVDAWKQIGDDSLKQRHVLTTTHHVRYTKTHLL